MCISERTLSDGEEILEEHITPEGSVHFHELLEDYECKNLIA